MSSSQNQKNSSFPVRFAKSAFFQIFVFFASIVLLGVTYAAWNNITTSEGAAGQPVTQTLVQKIINNLNDLDSRVTALSGSVGGIGYGQTWQDVTSSRAINATYTNTTSKPIIVNIIVGNPVSGSSTASLYVDGIVIDYYTTNAYNGGLHAIVPPGSSYKLVGGSISLALGAPYGWKELR